MNKIFENFQKNNYKEFEKAKDSMQKQSELEKLEKLKKEKELEDAYKELDEIKDHLDPYIDRRNQD